MSVLDRLDATRICSRWSPAPDEWALAIPCRPRTSATEGGTPFSWRSLARNPRAMVVTGVFGPLLAAESVIRGLAADPHAA